MLQIGDLLFFFADLLIPFGKFLLQLGELLLLVGDFPLVFRLLFAKILALLTEPVICLPKPVVLGKQVAQ